MKKLVYKFAVKEQGNTDQSETFLWIKQRQNTVKDFSPFSSATQAAKTLPLCFHDPVLFQQRWRVEFCEFITWRMALLLSKLGIILLILLHSRYLLKTKYVKTWWKQKFLLPIIRELSGAWGGFVWKAINSRYLQLCLRITIDEILRVTTYFSYFKLLDT